MASLAARVATKYLCNKSLSITSSSIYHRLSSFTTTQEKKQQQQPSQNNSKSRQQQIHSSILGEHIDELEEEHSYDRLSGISSSDDFVGVRGHSSVIDKADFAQARIGDVLEIPYECTISDFWRV